MKTSCLINNYNYSDFVVEAVKSALAQSVQFDEIIVVDDGSTDGSVELLKNFFGTTPNVQIILKSNGGQLSAFNAGYLASSGDIIFFLDSDDAYHPQYLEVALSLYQKREDCDYLIGKAEKVFKAEDGSYPEINHFDHVSESSLQVDNLGNSVVAALHAKLIVGGQTSVISVRRKILDKVLPYPNPEEWRTRADDYLAFGTAVRGAKKFIMKTAFIKYRIHAKNHSFYDSTTKDATYHYKREIAIERLITYFRTTLSLEGDLTFLAPLEFKTIAQPTREDFDRYTKIVRESRMKLSQKIRGFLVICKHMAQATILFRSKQTSISSS